MRQQMLFKSDRVTGSNVALRVLGVDDAYVGIGVGVDTNDRDNASNDCFSNTLTADAIELVSAQRGLDELKILMPLMKKFTSRNKRILLVAPPNVAFAPYLVSSGVDIRMLDVVQSDRSCIDVVNQIEQALQDDEHAMLITWLDWLPNSVVKRLQSAANMSKKILILFRQHEHHNSPFKVQIKVQLKDQDSVKGVRLTLMNQKKLHTQYDTGFSNTVDEQTSPVIYLDDYLAKEVSRIYH